MLKDITLGQYFPGNTLAHRLDPRVKIGRGTMLLPGTILRGESVIGDGCTIVAETVELLKIYGSDCKVLAASFKNAEQVHKCEMAGCHSVTVPADILKTLVTHPMTDSAITGFKQDWERVYGDKTILDF